MIFSVCGDEGGDEKRTDEREHRSTEREQGRKGRKDETKPPSICCCFSLINELAELDQVLHQ